MLAPTAGSYRGDRRLLLLPPEDDPPNPKPSPKPADVLSEESTDVVIGMVDMRLLALMLAKAEVAPGLLLLCSPPVVGDRRLAVETLRTSTSFPCIRT